MRYHLVPDFSDADFEKMLNEFIERLIKVLENELNQLGLEMLRDARLKTKAQGGYDDQTGNLRSSTFFRLIYEGQVVAEEFEESPRGTDRATGLDEGRKYAEKITRENPEGWGIVLGAGMEYASWVEAKGYDVITGATLGSEARLKKALDNVMRAFE